MLLICFSFFDEYFFNILWCSDMVMCCSFPVLGSVYVRKLVLVWVSHWDSLFDFVLHFISRYLKWALHVDKIHMCHSKLQTLRMHFPFQFTGRPIPLQNGCLFRINFTWYIARFCTGVNFLPRYNNRGDSQRHVILWWYHVNKCRAMRGNQSDLARMRKLPRCHVNTP